MTWMNLKPEALPGNVFYATSLATGTLTVTLLVPAELLHVVEATADEEGEEEPRLVLEYVIFVLVLCLDFVIFVLLLCLDFVIFVLVLCLDFELFVRL
jgi:hypothetical protein